eukprot:COSAG02_NODE_5909_length_3943_cov_2.182882_2_plen_502_part_00
MQLGSEGSEAVGFRGRRASPEEAALAYEQAESTLNFSAERLTSIAKLSSAGGSSVREEIGADAMLMGGAHGSLNLDAKRLASIAKGASSAASRAAERSAAAATAGDAAEQANAPPLSASVLWAQGAGRANATRRRSTLSPAETVVGVREVAADAIGQSVESLRAKLRSVTEDRAGPPRGFDVAPHLDSLAAISSQHVQQKRQEIAHAKSVLDKAMDEIRLCQEQEAAEFDSQVGALRGEFEQQMAQLEREFVMHAERYASQLQSAVEQCHEQHNRSLQRRTEVLLYSLTHPPRPHPMESGGVLHASQGPTAADAGARTQQESAISAGKRGRSSQGPSSLPSTISVASDSETADSMAMMSQAETLQAAAEPALDERVGSGSPLSPRARVAAWNDRQSSAGADLRGVAKDSMRQTRFAARQTSPSALSDAKSSSGMSGLNGGLDYAEPSPPGGHMRTGRGSPGDGGSSRLLERSEESINLDSSQMASTRSTESRHLPGEAAAV